MISLDSHLTQSSDDHPPPSFRAAAAPLQGCCQSNANSSPPCAIRASVHGINDSGKPTYIITAGRIAPRNELNAKRVADGSFARAGSASPSGKELSVWSMCQQHRGRVCEERVHSGVAGTICFPISNCGRFRPPPLCGSSPCARWRKWGRVRWLGPERTPARYGPSAGEAILERSAADKLPIEQSPGETW